MLWLTKRLRCKERSGSAVSYEEVEVVVAAKILQVGLFEKSIFRGWSVGTRLDDKRRGWVNVVFSKRSVGIGARGVRWRDWDSVEGG